MRYRLRLAIGYDEKHWSLATFEQDRERAYGDLIGRFKSDGGKLIDVGVEFPNGTPELATALGEVCRGREYEFDVWVEVVYSPKDVREARFVPLLSLGEPVDFDEDDVPLNTYGPAICRRCGLADAARVPNPYYVHRRVNRHRRDMYGAMNGITILAREALEAIWDEIARWVDVGEVDVRSEGKTIKSDVEYVWVRPKFEVGRLIDAKVLRTCEKCENPLEIRGVRLDDIFEQNKCTVESFKGTDAPIALAGNWFGEITSDDTCNQSQYVFIAGALHEKIRKLKLKGFVEADYVIHSAEEEQAEWAARAPMRRRK